MTVLSLTEATTLLLDFGLTVQRVQPLTGGMENTHVLAWTNGGPVVVTVLGKKTPQQALDYTALLDHLFSAGVPMPSLRRTRDGDAVSYYRDQPLIVSDYIFGTSPTLLDPVEVHDIGWLLATIIHRPAPTLVMTLKPHLRLYDADARTLDELPNTELGRWARHTWRAVAHVPNHDGSCVPIHADLFPDNVIITQAGHPVLIDWEDGSLDLPFIDLGMAIFGLCCTPEFSPIRAWALLSGYRDGTLLPDLDLLHDAARYAAVLIALRRFRWQQQHRLPADPARTPNACRSAEQSLNLGWDELCRRLSGQCGAPTFTSRKN